MIIWYRKLLILVSQDALMKSKDRLSLESRKNIMYIWHWSVSAEKLHSAWTYSLGVIIRRTMKKEGHRNDVDVLDIWKIGCSNHMKIYETNQD